MLGPNELGNSCKYFFDPMNVARDTVPRSCPFLRQLPYLPMRDKAILATLRCCISGYVLRIKEIFTTRGSVRDQIRRSDFVSCFGRKTIRLFVHDDDGSSPIFMSAWLIVSLALINGECGTEDAGTGNLRATPPVQGSTTRAPLAGLATVPRRHREEVELGFYPPRSQTDSS